MFIICLDKKINLESVGTRLDSPLLDDRISPDDNDNETINAKKTDSMQRTLHEINLTRVAFQMLHGCNSQNNSGNRWFDKTMQFIVSEDGYCGLNFERAPVDGIVVAQFCEHILRFM